METRLPSKASNDKYYVKYIPSICNNLKDIITNYTPKLIDLELNDNYIIDKKDWKITNNNECLNIPNEYIIQNISLTNNNYLIKNGYYKITGKIWKPKYFEEFNEPISSYNNKIILYEIGNDNNLNSLCPYALYPGSNIINKKINDNYYIDKTDDNIIKNICNNLKSGQIIKDTETKKYYIIPENNNIYKLDNNIECKTNMTLIEGMNMPNNLNKTVLNIIKKTTNKLSNEIRPLFNSNIKRPLYLVNNKLRLQRIRKEHFDKKIISKEKTDLFTYEITNGFTRKKYQYPGQIYYIDMVMQDYQKPKVVISHSGFEVGWDESGLLNLSDALSYILGDIRIYHNFKQLLSSKLIQFLLKIYKNNTMHDLYKLITKNLLYISLNTKLTDNIIYKHYAITEEEQEFIEKYI